MKKYLPVLLIFVLASFSSRPAFAVSDTLYFLHTDHLGSTRAVTDRDGNVVARYDYYPYGSIFNETMKQLDNETIERRYTSQIYDQASSLYFYNSRYYNPALGTFISPDPVQGPNRYAYVANNPINMIDPSGNQGIGYVLWTLLFGSGVNPVGEELVPADQIPEGAVVQERFPAGTIHPDIDLVQIANPATTGQWKSPLEIGVQVGINAAMGESFSFFSKFLWRDTIRKLGMKPLGKAWQLLSEGRGGAAEKVAEGVAGKSGIVVMKVAKKDVFELICREAGVRGVVTSVYRNGILYLSPEAGASTSLVLSEIARALTEKQLGFLAATLKGLAEPDLVGTGTSALSEFLPLAGGVMLSIISELGETMEIKDFARFFQKHK